VPDLTATVLSQTMNTIPYMCLGVRFYASHPQYRQLCLHIIRDRIRCPKHVELTGVEKKEQKKLDEEQRDLT
jgi:hypothetical protein